MPANSLTATDNLLSLEREVVCLFGRFTGAGEAAALKLPVKNGTVPFVVGEVVTSAGVGAGVGTIYSITGVGGAWDIPTGSGTATLNLIGVTGTFANNDNLTGDIAGVAAAAGAGTASVVYYSPTGLKGAGVASAVAGLLDGAAGEVVVALDNKWAGLLQFKHCVIDATSADDWEVTVIAETVATSKTITLRFFKDGTAAHPTTDDKLLFELVLSNAAPALAGY